MALTEGPIKDLWDGMPAVKRHAISLVAVGAMLAVWFFVGIREPLAAAAKDNDRQDKSITANIQRLDRAEQTLAEVSRTQAVQTNTIANMQETQRDTKAALDAINRKLDRMWEGRR